MKRGNRTRRRDRVIVTTQSALNSRGPVMRPEVRKEVERKRDGRTREARSERHYKTCPKCSGLYDAWHEICLTCKVTLRPATEQETRGFEENV